MTIELAKIKQYGMLVKGMSSKADKPDENCCYNSHRLQVLGKSRFSHCKLGITVTPTHRWINDDLSEVSLVCLAQCLAYIKSLILIIYCCTHVSENVQWHRHFNKQFGWYIDEILSSY